MRLLAEYLIEKLAAELKTKPGEFAPGIRAAKPKGAIPTVPRTGTPTTWWYVDHKHEAVKSGLHSDLRLSDGNKAYSWAVRKGIPRVPGERVLAVRTFDHSPKYISFEGQLPTGYGRTKGRGVWIEEEGPARVLEAGPDKIRWAFLKSQNPREYTMIHREGDDWILINTSPTPKTRPGVPQSKPKYREAKPEEFKTFLTNGARTAVTAKIDGAHVSINMDRDTPEVYSYRPSERDTGLLNHTYLAGLEKVPVPPELKGVRVRGEFFAVDKKGKTIPNRELAGIMNSSPQKGLETLKERGYKPRLAVFDVVTGKGGEPLESAPWKDKLEVLKEVKKRFSSKGFMLPEMAFTPKSQQDLFNKIKAKKSPLTDEGVVVWNLNQAGPPTKIKFRPDREVYIHTVYEGENQFKNKAVRYSYSVTPDGPAVGFVGTGFNDELRDWLWKNKDKIKGKKVIIKSSEQFPSGAWRAPSHSHFHL